MGACREIWQGILLTALIASLVGGTASDPVPQFRNATGRLTSFVDTKSPSLITDDVLYVHNGVNLTALRLSNVSDQLWAFRTQQCSGIVRRQSTIFCFTFISLMAISASDGKLLWRMDKDVLANELYAMSQRDVVVAASREPCQFQGINATNGEVLWTQRTEARCSVVKHFEAQDSGVVAFVVDSSTAQLSFRSFNVLTGHQAVGVSGKAFLLEDDWSLLWYCKDTDLISCNAHTGEELSVVVHACPVDVLPLAKPFSCESTPMNRICAVVSANSVAATAIGIPSGKQLWSLPSSARPDSSYSCVVHVFDGVVYLAQSSFSTVLSRISREGNVVWNVSVPYSYYIEDIVAVDATHLVTAGVDCIDVSAGVVVWSYGMLSIRPTTNFHLTKDARTLIFATGFGGVFFFDWKQQDPTYEFPKVVFLAHPYNRDPGIISSTPLNSAIVFGFTYYHAFAYDMAALRFLWVTPIYPLSEYTTAQSSGINEFGVTHEGFLYIFSGTIAIKVELDTGKVIEHAWLPYEECGARTNFGSDQLVFDSETKSMFFTYGKCLMRINSTFGVERSFQKAGVARCPPIVRGECVLFGDMRGFLHCFDKHSMASMWSLQLVVDDFPLLSYTQYGTMVFVATESHIFSLVDGTGSLRVDTIATVPKEDHSPISRIVAFNGVVLVDAGDFVYAYSTDLGKMLWRLGASLHGVVKESSLVLLRSPDGVMIASLSTGEALPRVTTMEPYQILGMIDMAIIVQSFSSINIVNGLNGKTIRTIGYFHTDRAAAAEVRSSGIAFANRDTLFKVFGIQDKIPPPAAPQPTVAPPSPTLPPGYVSPTVPPLPHLPPELRVPRYAAALPKKREIALNMSVSVSLFASPSLVIVLDKATCILAGVSLTTEKVVWQEHLVSDCKDIQERGMHCDTENCTSFFTFGEVLIHKWSSATGQQVWTMGSAQRIVDPSVHAQYVVYGSASNGDLNFTLLDSITQTIRDFSLTRTRCFHDRMPAVVYVPSAHHFLLYDEECIGAVSALSGALVWNQSFKGGNLVVLADPRSELVVVRPFFEPFFVFDVTTGKVKCSSNFQTRGVSFEFYTGTAGTYVFGYSGTNMNLHDVTTCQALWQKEGMKFTLAATFTPNGMLLLVHGRSTDGMTIMDLNGTAHEGETESLRGISRVPVFPGTDAASSVAVVYGASRDELCVVNTTARTARCTKPLLDVSSAAFAPSLSAIFTISSDTVTITDVSSLFDSLFEINSPAGLVGVELDNGMDSSAPLRKMLLIMESGVLRVRTNGENINQTHLISDAFAWLPPTFTTLKYVVSESFIFLFGSRNVRQNHQEPIKNEDVRSVVVINRQTLRILEEHDFEDWPPYATIQRTAVHGDDVFFTSDQRVLHQLKCEDGAFCRVRTFTLEYIPRNVRVVEHVVLVEMEAFELLSAYDARTMDKKWTMKLVTAHIIPEVVLLGAPGKAVKEVCILDGYGVASIDVNEGQRKWYITFANFSGENTEIAYDPETGYLLALGDGYLVQAYRMEDRAKPVWTVKMNPVDLYEQAFFVLGTNAALNGVVVVSVNGELHGLKAQTGEELWTLPIPFFGQPDAVAAQGLLHVTATTGHYVINVLTGRVVMSYAGVHGRTSTGLAVSAAGAIVTYGSYGPWVVENRGHAEVLCEGSPAEPTPAPAQSPSKQMSAGAIAVICFACVAFVAVCAVYLLKAWVSAKSYKNVLEEDCEKAPLNSNA